MAKRVYPPALNAHGKLATPTASATVQSVDSITIAGRRYVVTDEQMVTVDYYKTVRRHGVEVKEYAPYSYVAVTVRDDGRTVEA